VIALDASALLAFLLRERGHQRVSELLGKACMSTVNFSEVLARFARTRQDVVLIGEKLLILDLPSDQPDGLGILGSGFLGMDQVRATGVD
jgi:uncharacterized protein with PIN domain